MKNFTQNNRHLAIFRWLLLSFFCLPNFSAAQPIINLNEGEEVTCASFEFYDSLPIASEVASLGGKSIMVYLYDNYSLATKETTTRIFTDPRVIELCSEKMLLLDGNIRKDFGFTLKGKYEVKEVPAVLFIGPGEKLLIPPVSGSISVEKMLGILDDVILVIDRMPDTKSGFLIETSEFLMAQAQFTSGERSPEFLRNYVRQCKKFSGEDWYSPLSEFYRVVPAVSLGSDENMAFTMEFADNYQSAAYNELAKKLPFYIAKFTERAVYEKIKDAYSMEVREIIRNTKQGDKIEYPSFEAFLVTSNKLTLPEKAKAKLRFEMRSLYYLEVQKAEEYLKSAVQYLDAEGGLEVISMDELNDIAWSFAAYATQKQDIDKALAWSAMIKAKAVHQPSYYETYAALLYRKGDTRKSLSVLKTAMEIARPSGKNHRSILHLEQIIVKKQPLPNTQKELNDQPI